MSAVDRTACLLLLPLVLALALPAASAASCDATPMAGSSDAAAAETPAEDSGGPATAISAPPTRSAAATPRGDAPPAPRARWHRYLPGMFK